MLEDLLWGVASGRSEAPTGETHEPARPAGASWCQQVAQRPWGRRQQHGHLRKATGMRGGPARFVRPCEVPVQARRRRLRSERSPGSMHGSRSTGPCCRAGVCVGGGASFGSASQQGHLRVALCRAASAARSCHPGVASTARRPAALTLASRRGSLRLGSLRFQPSKFARLALIVFMAYSLEKKAHRIKDFSVGFLPHVVVMGGLALLILKQPDFGSAVILAGLLAGEVRVGRFVPEPWPTPIPIPPITDDQFRSAMTYP